MEIPRYLSSEEVGAVIDEGYSRLDGLSFIDLSLYGDDGDMVLYTVFERNVTPFEIVDLLQTEARNLILDPPRELPDKDVLAISELMQREAIKILQSL